MAPVVHFDIACGVPEGEAKSTNSGASRLQRLRPPRLSAFDSEANATGSDAELGSDAGSTCSMPTGPSSPCTSVADCSTALPTPSAHGGGCASGPSTALPTPAASISAPRSSPRMVAEALLELAAVAPPPGLEPAEDGLMAGVEDGLPSVGSALHAFGRCKPCGWFWKSQGCGNGADCLHCHVCPRGALKVRRKAKMAALKSASVSAAAPEGQTALALSLSELLPPVSSSAATTPLVSPLNCPPPPPPGLPQVTASLIPTPPLTPAMPSPVSSLDCEKPLSVGSALHGTGMCKPCGWFYKEGGCRNGQDCRHCHLCPASEFKARKKDKLRAAAADMFAVGGAPRLPAASPSAPTALQLSSLL